MSKKSKLRKALASMAIRLDLAEAAFDDAEQEWFSQRDARWAAETQSQKFGLALRALSNSGHGFCWCDEDPCTGRSCVENRKLLGVSP